VSRIGNRDEHNPKREKKERERNKKKADAGKRRACSVGKHPIKASMILSAGWH
jgi:hypothetical protein